MSETTKHFTTTGMHCRSCSMLVDMTLGELDGVLEAHTELETGDTVVTFDEAATNDDAIISAIRGAGYDAEVAS